MNYEIITAPLIGAVIGTVTNGIAIKMLFRPWNAIYIGKFQVPFTPGLIPKEKPRIAKAIAKVVGGNLLDDETIRKTLLSEKMKEKILNALDQKIDMLSEYTETVSELLASKGFLETIDTKETELKTSASGTITKKLVDGNTASALLDFATDELTKNANPMISGIASKAINSARDSIIAKINSIITEKAPSIIAEFIDTEYEKIKNMPVSECIVLLKEKFPDYHEKLWNIYEQTIRDHLSKMLHGLNISEIVEQKINEFELPELERIIMEIARKELNALVALGGLLGFIMGFINVLLP